LIHIAEGLIDADECVDIRSGAEAVLL